MPDNLNNPELVNNELISDDIKEIVSHRPNWIIRKGNVFLFLILILIFILTWFIHYPDIVMGSARLVAVNEPRMVIAKTDAKIEKLLVKNEQPVSAGQPLAYIQSNGKHEQVLLLQAWVQSKLTAVIKQDYDAVITDSLPAFTQLGEIQSSYQELSDLFHAMKQILKSGYYEKKRQAIQKDLEFLSALKNSNIQQKQLYQLDSQLENKEYSVYQFLAKEKVIAPLELDEYQKRLLAKVHNIKSVDAQIANSNLSMLNKKSELLELSKNIADLEIQFQSKILNIQNDIQKWIQQYIVTAPEDGKVFFMGELQTNQLVAVGQELFFIQPPNSHYYGVMQVGQVGFGKIKVGQKILLNVKSYPKEEFGYLAGKVAYISNLPNQNDSFSVRIELLNGVKTSYNKDIYFRNNLSAQAEIITDNRRLFNILFQKFATGVK